MRPAVYIPNYNGSQRLGRALGSLREQTRPVDVVVVDNGSVDDSVALVREEFPEVTLLELGRNLGFGSAINRAANKHPADPMILLNNDVECEPGFVEALLEAAGGGAEMVAGVLLQESTPGKIDSAGVVANRTLMGFDYLHGEPVTALEGAADPLGPTGGAALYRRDAFEAVGGFDERIFLYYEDLDLALRLAAVGGRCHLAAGARALHAYSASLGAGSGEQVRAYRLEPRLHAAPLRGDVGSRAGAPRARLRGGHLHRADADYQTAAGCEGDCRAGTTGLAWSGGSSTKVPCSTSRCARRWHCAVVGEPKRRRRGYATGRGSCRRACRALPCRPRSRGRSSGRCSPHTAHASGAGARNERWRVRNALDRALG